jgi:hypothetical protein
MQSEIFDSHYEVEESVKIQEATVPNNPFVTEEQVIICPIKQHRNYIELHPAPTDIRSLKTPEY